MSNIIYRTACIYKITNIITQDFYIGKTIKSAEERFLQHIYSSRYGSNTHLHRALRKYGSENFIVETIESVEREFLSERERFHIHNLHPKYNMTEGGDGGYTSNSSNFIRAMKKYHSKRDKSSYATYGMFGKKQSEKCILAIRKSNSCPVVCEGITYSSVNEAQKANPSISIRKRLDNSKYPQFYRLRNKTCRPRK